MLGVVTTVLVSVGGAAAVLAAIAHRYSPEAGWRELLRSGVHSARTHQMAFKDDHKTDDGATGGLADLFTVAQPVEWPAYTEVTDLRAALHRVRRVAHRRRPLPGAVAPAPETPVAPDSRS